MLIHSSKPRSKASLSEGAALAQKLEKKELPVEDLYAPGRWQFEFSNNLTTYQLDRKKAMEVLEEQRSGSATYTVFGASGPFKSLSEADKKKRKARARDEAIVKGVGTAIAGGVVITGGAAVLGVLGSVGSLLTRSSGGGGIGIGLGAVAAIAGLAGLGVAAVTYKEGLSSAAPEIVQTGYAKIDGEGFQFTPNSESPDQRVVRVTQESVTPLKK